MAKKLMDKLEHHNNESRYNRMSVYKNDESNFYLELPKFISIKQTDEDLHFKVEIRTQNRLDLIANIFYKNSKLWWIIALANDIEDPFDVPVGTILRIPGISTIYGFGGILQ